MTNPQRPLALALVVLLSAALPGLAQDDKAKPKARPLSEDALIKLAKSDLEDEVIVALVKKRGVSFQVDDAALKRLKDAGVSGPVLAALGPAEAEPKPGTGVDKPLATAKHDTGLIIEVLEVKPTRNQELIIRWRYRNPTKKPIELIAATPPFATRSSPPNIAAKFWKSVYYKEGKFETDKVYNHFPLVIGDTSKASAKDLGKAAVVVRPDQEFEIWCLFTLPVDKSEKTVMFSVMGAPLIKDIPIQSPGK